MMQCKVDMSVPQVRLMEFKELGKIMGGEEIIMAGIYLGIEGDIAGSIMFLLEKQAARHLVDKLMGMSMEGEEFSEMDICDNAVVALPAPIFPSSLRTSKYSSDISSNVIPPTLLVDKLMGMSMEGEEFSEMEFSALKEVGNIITAAYLNSLSSLTGLRIQPSVPDLTVDMAGGIFSVRTDTYIQISHTDFYHIAHNMTSPVSICQFTYFIIMPQMPNALALTPIKSYHRSPDSGQG